MFSSWLTSADHTWPHLKFPGISLWWIMWTCVLESLSYRPNFICTSTFFHRLLYAWKSNIFQTNSRQLMLSQRGIYRKGNLFLCHRSFQKIWFNFEKCHYTHCLAARSWAKRHQCLSSRTFQRRLSQTTGKNVCLKLMVLSSHLRPNRTNKKHLCQTASFIT